MTFHQLRAGYARNAAQLDAMAAKARTTGRPVNGMSLDVLTERAARYLALSTADDDTVREAVTRRMSINWHKGIGGGETTLVNRIRYTTRRVNGFRYAGSPRWWLYVNGLRYSPTGRFEDAVSFDTQVAARTYAETLMAADA